MLLSREFLQRITVHRKFRAPTMQADRHQGGIPRQLACRASLCLESGVHFCGEHSHIFRLAELAAHSALPNFLGKSNQESTVTPFRNYLVTRQPRQYATVRAVRDL